MEGIQVYVHSTQIEVHLRSAGLQLEDFSDVEEVGYLGHTPQYITMAYRA
jgi:hypothetical protein